MSDSREDRTLPQRILALHMLSKEPSRVLSKLAAEVKILEEAHEDKRDALAFVASALHTIELPPIPNYHARHCAIEWDRDANCGCTKEKVQRDHDLKEKALALARLHGVKLK